MDERISPNIFRLLRIAKDMKVKELADMLRVTPSYINAIENGTRIPSSRLVKDYAEAFEVDESIIITFNKEANENTCFEKLMLKLLLAICE